MRCRGSYRWDCDSARSQAGGPHPPLRTLRRLASRKRGVLCRGEWVRIGTYQSRVVFPAVPSAPNHPPRKRTILCVKDISSVRTRCLKVPRQVCLKSNFAPVRGFRESHGGHTLTHTVLLKGTAWKFANSRPARTFNYFCFILLSNYPIPSLLISTVPISRLNSDSTLRPFSCSLAVFDKCLFGRNNSSVVLHCSICMQNGKYYWYLVFTNEIFSNGSNVQQNSRFSLRYLVEYSRVRFDMNMNFFADSA